MTQIDDTSLYDDQSVDGYDMPLTFDESVYVTIVEKKLGLGCLPWNPNDHTHMYELGVRYTIKMQRPREYSVHGEDGQLIKLFKLDEFKPSAYCRWLARACW